MLQLLATKVTPANVIKFAWNPDACMHWMHQFRNDGQRCKLIRQAVLWTTVARLGSIPRKSLGSFTLVNPPEVSSELLSSSKSSISQSPKSILLCANDTIECIIFLRENTDAQNISALVMASRSKLGGGYQNGSKAQEEDIYRCTSLSLLHEEKLSLPRELSVAVFRRAVICRGSEEFGYPILKHAVTANFISATAISNPSIEGDDGDRMDSSSATLFRAKMDAVIEQAIALDTHALVLGAWGCGVYSCPPTHVARIMRECNVLSLNQFSSSSVSCFHRSSSD